MFINWQAIGTICAIFGLIVTIVIFIVQTYIANKTNRIERLLKFSETFDSVKMVNLRSKAAKKMKDKPEAENLELDYLFGFFATIATVDKEIHFPTKLVYDQFSYWIVRYWLIGQNQLRLSRIPDPRCFESFEQLGKKLLNYELNHGYEISNYSKDILMKFLNDEANLKLE